MVDRLVGLGECLSGRARFLIEVDDAISTVERWPSQLEGHGCGDLGRADPGGIDAELAHLTGQDALVGAERDIAAEDVSASGIPSFLFTDVSGKPFRLL